MKQQLAAEAMASDGGGAPSRRQLLLALAAVPGVYVPQVSAAWCFVLGSWPYAAGRLLAPLLLASFVCFACPLMHCWPACTALHCTALQLYNVRYESATGPLLAIEPAEVGVPLAVQKQTYRGNTLASSTGGVTACPALLPALCLMPSCLPGTFSPVQLRAPAPLLAHTHTFAKTVLLPTLYCLRTRCTAPAVVSSRMAWENIFMTEVVRSCPEMCR